MIDTSSLFLHVLGAMGILGGAIVQALAGARVRAAVTGRDIATWAGFARSAGALIGVSALVSLLTGGHLAGAVWTTETSSGFSEPFITLGIIGLVLLAPIGPMVGGKRLRHLAREGESVGAETAPANLVAHARGANLWGPVHSLLGVGVGFVALMVYKPGWVVGAVLLVVTFAAGWVAGSLLAARAMSS